jgi:hypothetical protein
MLGDVLPDLMLFSPRSSSRSSCWRSRVDHHSQTRTGGFRRGQRSHRRLAADTDARRPLSRVAAIAPRKRTTQAAGVSRTSAWRRAHRRNPARDRARFVVQASAGGDSRLAGRRCGTPVRRRPTCRRAERQCADRTTINLAHDWRGRRLLDIPEKPRRLLLNPAASAPPRAATRSPAWRSTLRLLGRHTACESRDRRRNTTARLRTPRRTTCPATSGTAA